jgi:hypothetical protein
MRMVFVLMALLLAFPFSLGASGAEEQKKPEQTKTIHVYLLAANGGDAEMYALDRMDLPAARSLFGWTRFTLRGQDVSTDSSGGYSLGSHSIVSRNEAGGAQVIEYEVTIRPQSAGSQTAKSTVKTVFVVKDCLGTKGDVVLQPTRLAVMRAVREGGLASGFVRVTELLYLGEGRFSALVELR